MNERMRKRRSEYYCRIDASAFAGVFCVLLFLFMSPAATPETGKWISVDLFLAAHSRPMPGARREDAMLLSVTRDGHVYFGARTTTPDELPARIRDGLRGGAENWIYLAVDSRAGYSGVKVVLDRIREAGVERVSFLVQPRR
jgi:biopolymer transport protein ExbD